MLTSSCHAFLFRRSHFLSAHIKTTTAKVLSCSFCSPLMHADDVLFFYSNVHRSVRVNRGHHHTVYTHVVAKFIRYMPHRVTCNDLRIAKIVQYVSGFRYQFAPFRDKVRNCPLKDTVPVTSCRIAKGTIVCTFL